MKRLLSFLAVGAFLWPALQPVRGADVSINFFYDNLSGGNWYEVADYGYVWQPDIAATDPNWRPYTDGYWAYTDLGWTWVSYEDFGWAAYHYGRWARLADYGWVWVPGYEWGPAWVSWRTGGDYVGWAPLPPAGPNLELVYESRPIYGPVDVEFGIGPAYYNFIDVRYIGEPVLRDRILPWDRNVTIINNTVNVTNITYRNSVVYNYGPDYATVSAYSVRPIQRLKIERESLDPMQAVKAGSVTKVQGNKLLLAAPMKVQKATSAQVAPRQVRARIQQPKVEKGWANVDPSEKAQIEQRFKTENPKNVPKPNIQPRSAGAGANVNAGASPQATAGAAAERAGKGRQQRERAQAQPGTSPATSPGTGRTDQFQRGKGKQERERVERERAQRERAERERAESERANAGAATGAAPNSGGNLPDRQREGERQRDREREQAAGPMTPGAQNENPNVPREQRPGKARQRERSEREQTVAAPSGAGAGEQERQRNEARRTDRENMPVPAREMPAQRQQLPRDVHAAPRPVTQTPPAQVRGQGEQVQGAGRQGKPSQGRGKQKPKKEAEQTPSPQ